MDFRNYKIIRTCTKKYADYKSYKPFLAEDFNHRCAYCNLLDSEITSFFEIDHFVPQAEIDKNPDYSFLKQDYNNLVYACRNCNGEKSDLFEGNIKDAPYGNNRFYDPVKKDYNEVFYRNNSGTICSNDTKGKNMIVDLKLYRPINNLAWICEQLDMLSHRLDDFEKSEEDPKRKQLIKDAKTEALWYYLKCKKIHIANYNNKKFSISDVII